MGIAERKDRQRAEREQCIVSTARLIAEREGWDAVTVRRLAREIEYSQPVLYSHFESRDAIVSAVAIEGFREFTAVLRRAESETTDRRNAAQNVALAYLAFARERSAIYEAMFTLPTSLRFAQAGAKPEMKEAFAAIAAVVSSTSDDTELTTETFWSTLHGIAELERSGRIRTAVRDERIALVVRRLLSSD